MKILVLCSFGRNRSRALAKYLCEKGYDADFDGVENEHDAVQKKIDASEVVVTVHSVVKEKLVSDFDIAGKRLIELDVEDRPQCVLPSKKSLSGDAWTEFQQTEVYPQLIQQISKYF